MKHRSTIRTILLLREAYPESSAQTIASVLELTPAYVRLLLKSNGLLPLGIRGFPIGHPRGPKPKHWAQRTKDIIALRQANGLLTLKEIGDRVGVTHERVRQILKRAGLPTRGINPNAVFCAKCQRKLMRRPKDSLCRPCHMKALGRPATLPCGTCGKDIPMTPARWSNHKRYLKLGFPGNVYCDRTCRNKSDSLSKGYGWQRRLTHCKRGHPLSGDNLSTAPSIRFRVCKACKRMHSKAQTARRRAAIAAAIDARSPKAVDYR